MAYSPIGNLGTVLLDAMGKTSAIREDLADFVANIDPTETPLLNSLPRTNVQSTLHEWLQDSLRSRNSRGIVEGRDWQAPTKTAPTRETNYTEIFGEELGASRTVQAINPAGFNSFYAYELEKATKSTMIDIEVAIQTDGTTSTGSSSTGRVMKSMENFFTTNRVLAGDYTGTVGVDGSNAGILSTNGQDIHNHLQTIWTAGGKIDLIVANASAKHQFSAQTWPGSSQNVRNILAQDGRLVIPIQVIETDFGVIPLMLNRWTPQSTNTGTSTATSTDVSSRVWFLQRDNVRLAFLRPFEHNLMGVRGDSIAGMVTAELTMEVGNEAACGVMAELNNKSSVT